MTDPHTGQQIELRRDLQRLREMKRTAEELHAAGDPLLRGQYLHLVGRLDALIDIVATTAGDFPGGDFSGGDSSGGELP